MELILEPAHMSKTLLPTRCHTLVNLTSEHKDQIRGCSFSAPESSWADLPLRSISYSLTQFMYCGLRRMSSAVNLPASLGPKDPAATRPGSIAMFEGKRLWADHAVMLHIPLRSQASLWRGSKG